MTDVLEEAGLGTEADAGRLVAEFGSLPELFAVDDGRLEAVAIALAPLMKALARLVRRSAEASVSASLHLDTYDGVLKFLRQTLAGQEIEQLIVLFLGTGHKLLKVEVVATGSVDRCPVYPREIVRRALQLNATSLVLAHNHPSGIVEPSREDILVTRTLIDSGRCLGVAVHDHIIVGGNQQVSMKALGLI